MDAKQRAKQIFGAIALVTGVVILIAIASLIVGSIFASNVFSATVTEAAITNETLSNVDNVTTQDFAILSTFPTGTTCLLLDVVNETDGVTIAAGNYTQPTTCQLLATTEGANSSFGGGNWSISYNYSNTDPAVIINITVLSDGFSAFVLGIVTFLGIIGIIVGIVWLISYLKPLFSKDDGIQSFASS